MLSDSCIHNKHWLCWYQVRLGDLNMIVPCVFSTASQQPSSHLERPSMLILSVKSCSLASTPSQRSSADTGETTQTASGVLSPSFPSSTRKRMTLVLLRGYTQGSLTVHCSPGRPLPLLELLPILAHGVKLKSMSLVCLRLHEGVIP